MIIPWSTRASIFIIIFIGFLTVIYLLKWLIIRKGKKLFSFLFSIWRSIKQAIAENPEVIKFIERHKILAKFIKNRLKKNHFYGRPLTLLSLALLYILFLFGGVIESIINSEIIVSADIRAANLLAAFRHPALTRFFFWVTLLGKWQIVLIFTIAAILILWLWNKRSYIIPLLLCIAGSEIFTFAGKLIFHRARPSVALYLENSFSFPSGHATIAIALYGFIAYVLIKHSKKWKRKINIFFITFILIFLIGFSRLYLGVHYVSDVWGGYLVGAIWLIIAIGFLEYFLHKKQKPDTFFPKTKKRLATFGLIFASIFLYIIFGFNYQTPELMMFQASAAVTTTEVMNIFNPDQLKYTETLLGNIQEPLSFVIIAKNDQQLLDLFQKAGWQLADNISVPGITKLARAAFWKNPYSQAPITPDFWNANVHDFGFEKATDANNVRTRHHARFWKTNYIMENGAAIYVGTASFDSGIKWGITHQISPDIDTEREFLYNDLQSTGMITNATKQQFVAPKLGINFLGDLFFTDGKLYLITTPVD